MAAETSHSWQNKVGEGRDKKKKHGRDKKTQWQRQKNTSALVLEARASKARLLLALKNRN